MPQDNPLYRHPAMRELESAVRREGQLQFLACLGILLFGMALTAVFFRTSVLMTILGLGIFVIGIKVVFEAGENMRLDQNRLLVVLRDQPEKIVWVFTMVTERMPFGFRFMRSGLLYFKLSNGDQFSVSLPTRKLKLVSKFLNRLLPHATFGYSKERDRQYQQSPEMLRRK